jgi:hypothetical protein
MKEVTSLIFQYGGTVIMAALFVYIFFQERKDLEKERENNNTVLQELSKSNNNIAESLNLLKTSMDNTNSEFKQHDERAIQEFGNIKNDLTILKERKKV